MLKIVQAPEAVLSQIAKPVKTIDKAITNLLAEMEETLAHASDPEGVGLAAPQVGKSLQIFIIRQTPRSPLLTFINPQIIEFSDGTKEKKLSKAKSASGGKRGVQLEGCLSLKDIWGIVKRHQSISVSFMNEKGEKHTKTFDGFLATIIQHEYDHLQGVLFPKRVLEQKQQLYHSKKNTKGETEFEEMTL
jgi:peptide deformylase